ncbi:MAG: hypothetical protein R2939_12255 [Kofleriaceae bacterium]
MLRRRTQAAVLALAVAAGCGAAIPRQVDGAVAEHGVPGALADARRAVVESPRDVDARRRLAALEDRAGNLGAALAELHAAELLGGPLGSRLTAAERRRAGELRAARAAVRLRVGDPTALDDLDRAAADGVAVDPAVRRQAQRLRALVELRHAAIEVRRTGRMRLAASGDDAIARGAGANPTAADLFALARWAWDGGAKRAAWEAIDDWAAAASAPSDDEVRTWAAIARWWHPPGWAPGTDALGARARALGACGGVGGCEPATAQMAAAGAAVAAALRALVLGGAPGWSVAMPALPGELDDAPAWARPTLARRAADARAPALLTNALAGDVADSDDARLVLAAEASLAGVSTAHVDALLAPVVGPAADALRTRLARGAIDVTPPAVALVVATYASAQAARPELASALALLAADVVAAPARVDRRVRELFAADVDETSVAVACGALFDLLGDPGRARASWQRAVGASATASAKLGLAAAAARGGDAPAAMVAAIEGAAGIGDPAPALTAVAAALVEAGAEEEALTLLHDAIDLAGPDEVAASVVLAVAASRALGRDAQADALAHEWRAWLPAPAVVGDPTDARAALATGDAAALAVASYWHPADLDGVAARAALVRSLPPDDPRRRQAEAELAALAGAPAPALAWAAARVLVRR